MPSKLTEAAQVLREFRKEPERPEFNEEEKKWLLQALQPGTPFHRILVAAVDNADALRDHIAAEDLSRPEGVALARSRQAQRTATFTLIDYIYSYATPKPEEPSNGR